jgi:hypothetical protein
LVKDKNRQRKETLMVKEKLRGRRAGRPSNINIDAEDAKILRETVKLHARYFGIRLKDLGPGWITAAMRKKAPLSVETALALLKCITYPDSKLVGKRHPQGTSNKEVFELVIDRTKAAEGSPKPGSFEDVKDDVGFRRYGFVNFASLIMQKYQLPMPGTAVFVMPGTARIVAAKLAELLPLEGVGKQRRREIIEALGDYFELGEKPLRAELGKELVPRLTYLSLAENLAAVADYVTTEGWDDQDLKWLEDWANNVMRSEDRRKRAKRRARPAPAAQANPRRTSK